ncbi:MAG: universal stress protein [Bythopirellula sp.]
MNINTILIATDFSSDSEAALRHASALAAAEGAKLCIAHIDDDTPGLVFGHVGYGYVPSVDEIAREQYDKLLTILPTNEGVTFEHRFLRGNAAESILQLAKEAKADLIVIGTHGKTGLRRLLMGSVAEQVVRRAECPVLTIKQPSTGTGGEKRPLQTQPHSTE